MHNKILLMAGFLFVTTAAFSSDKTGTSAAQFLKMGMGARPAGMGESFVGLADDVNAIYWNPAGTAQIEKKEFTAMHTIWFEDIFFSNVAYCQKGFGGTVGGAVNFLSAGKIEKVDNAGIKLNETYSPQDLMALVLYARPVGEILVGANFKFISSKMEDEKATGVASDISVLYKRLQIAGKSLPVGASLQNIGTKMKFVREEDSLPLTLKVGCSYNILRRTTLALDINFPSDNDVNTHIGGEYVYELENGSVAGRMGYKTDTIDELDALSGLTVGLGFRWENYGLDYAWGSYGDLGNTHRFSINLRFE